MPDDRPLPTSTIPPAPPPALTVPDPSLVLIVGAQGSGTGGFARRHFTPQERLEGVPAAERLQRAGERLAGGLLTVLHGPFLTPLQRHPLVQLAQAHDLPACALLLDLDSNELDLNELDLNEPGAGGLDAGSAHLHPADAQQDIQLLRRNLGGPDLAGLTKEGLRPAYRLRGRAAADAAHPARRALTPDRRGLTGPFDLVGDVHGCLPELLELLALLGYALEAGGEGQRVTPPPGRTAVFLGDLGDRGPDTPGVLRLVMGMVRAGTALCVAGNHDAKLGRVLSGRSAQLTHGTEVSLEQLERETPEFRARARDFLCGLPTHLLLDGGRLVAAHAGLPEHLQGRVGGRVREFALYGDVAGHDAAGLPIRRNWAAHYGGAALVAYGHTPVLRPAWQRRTINLDTGCVFGGRLTALRYPEERTVSVPARAIYRQPPRPIPPPPEPDQGGSGPTGSEPAAPVSAEQS